MRLIWAGLKAEYFPHDIWTGGIGLIAREKFAFWYKSFCGPSGERKRREKRRSNTFVPDGQSTTRRPRRAVEETGGHAYVNLGRWLGSEWNIPAEVAPPWARGQRSAAQDRRHSASIVCSEAARHFATDH
jgi:hypothetical protein